MKLDGKVAVAFGSAGGIGKSYCESLLKRNAKVCCVDILEEAGKKTVAEFSEKYGKENVMFCLCDATKDEDIKNTLLKAKSEFGGLDIIVNSVGAINEANWAFTIDINLGTTIRLTVATLELIGKDKGGQGGVLVHTASNAAIIPGFYGPAYSAAKAGVVSYVRAMSHKLNYEQHGVRMIAMCPTITNTPLLSISADIPGRLVNAEIAKQIVNFSDTDAMLTTEEVAEAMVGAVIDDTLTGVAVQVVTSTPTILFKDENTQIALRDKVEAAENKSVPAS